MKKVQVCRVEKLKVEVGFGLERSSQKLKSVRSLLAVIPCDSLPSDKGDF